MVTDLESKQPGKPNKGYNLCVCLSKYFKINRENFQPTNFDSLEFMQNKILSTIQD